MTLSAEQEKELFLDFQSPETELGLKLAWKRVVASTIKDTKDRVGIRGYSAQTEKHLEMLSEELNGWFEEDAGNIYTPVQPHFLYGPKDNKSIRIRTFLEIRDRIVYQHIGNLIIENSIGELSQEDEHIFAHLPNERTPDGKYNIFTFRRTFSSKGHEGQYNKFLDAVYQDQKDFNEANDIWMLKTDIASFYYSLDHLLIRNMLERNGWLKNECLLDLLMQCLSIWSEQDGVAAGQGVPVGYETSELIATLYLLDIDKNFDGKLPARRRRFVDDMYFFIEGREATINFLVDYDLALQRKSLVRNTAKTKIEECNDELIEQSELDRNLRGNLSFISDTIKSLEKKLILEAEDKQTERDLQNALLDLFRGLTIEIDGQETHFIKGNSEVNRKLIQAHASTLAFILWRLKEHDTIVRDIAIMVLGELPNKALHAAKYLGRFTNDDTGKNALFKYMRYSHFDTVKIECAKALIDIYSGMNKSLRSEIRGWLEDEVDWYLQKSAIELLSEHSTQHEIDELFQEVAVNNSKYCYLVRATALNELYRHYTDEGEKIDLIKQAFYDQSDMINALGVYIARRNESISREDLDPPPRLKSLILSSEKMSEIELFVSRFKKRFNFEISYPRDADLIEKIPDIERANQYLADLLDEEPDPLLFIEALHNFVTEYLMTLERLTSSGYLCRDLNEYLAEKEGEISNQDYSALNSLRDAYNYVIHLNLEKDEKYQKIRHANKNQHLEKITRLIGRSLAGYYIERDVELSPEVQKYQVSKEKEKNMSYKYDVFISHSSADKDILEQVTHQLEQNGIKYWLDSEQIKPNSRISQEIERGIESSRHLLLCLSQNMTRSGWVRAEYTALLNPILSGDTKYSIIVLVLDDTRNIPVLLRDWHRTRLKDSQGVDKLLDFLKS